MSERGTPVRVPARADRHESGFRWYPENVGVREENWSGRGHRTDPSVPPQRVNAHLGPHIAREVRSGSSAGEPRPCQHGPMTLVEPELATEPAARDIDPLLVAEEIGNTDELKRKSKVRAFTPLPGVPEGATGIVTLVNGWDPWIRYRVLWDNGVDLGAINREHLVPAKRYDEMVEKRRRAIESGAFDQPEEAAVVAEGGDGPAAASGEGATVNGVAIPTHLLERSKAARQRLAG